MTFVTLLPIPREMITPPLPVLALVIVPVLLRLALPKAVLPDDVLLTVTLPKPVTPPFTL